MSDMPCRITQEHVLNDPQDASDHTPDDDTIGSLREDVEYLRKRCNALRKEIARQDSILENIRVLLKG